MRSGFGGKFLGVYDREASFFCVSFAGAGYKPGLSVFVSRNVIHGALPFGGSATEQVILADVLIYVVWIQKSYIGYPIQE